MEAPTRRVLGPAGGRYREMMEGKKPGRGLCGGILGRDGMGWNGMGKKDDHGQSSSRVCSTQA